MLVLPGEISTGVSDASSDVWFAGWCGTVAAERLLLAVEKSAEAVLPAGIVDRWEGLNAKPSVKDVRARDDRVDRSQPRSGVWRGGVGG